MNTLLKTEVNETPAVISTNEFLSFQLGQEEFCLGILKVQEIRGYGDITKIANTPDYIKGVVNLRGEIVPIVDLRIKLNFKDVKYDEFTVVIILNLQGNSVGIVVDSVSDVITFKEDQIQDFPEMLSSVTTEFMMGVVTLDSHTYILLDIEKLISKNELGFAQNKAMH